MINCTGPLPSNSVESNPVIGSLLVSGVLRPDELSLGIETTPEGNAIDADGREVADLFLVGTLRKSTDWESTAVPELRSQAAAAAEGVLGLLADRVGRPARPDENGDGWVGAQREGFRGQGLEVWPAANSHLWSRHACAEIVGDGVIWEGFATSADDRRNFGRILGRDALEY